MSDQLGPSESAGFESLDLPPPSEETVLRGLPMMVQKTALQRSAERKRIKRSILAESEEQLVFEKTLYLPYLYFSYSYPTQKGLWSKQTVQGQGRSALLALREVDFGFYPEMVSLTHQLMETRPEPDSIIEGVDSTVLVSERLEELKLMLSNYDNQLQQLTSQYDSLAKTDPAREVVKDSIDHLKKTRETRWKLFADGLKLPHNIDLEKLELVEGTLFYLPYFMVRFRQSRESRFLVWDREGKENESIAEELAKNSRFRELVQSYAKS